VLGDASVSRRHARLVRSGDGIAVVDLKSKRGTWVGSTRLEPYAKPTPIEAGMFVQFGTVTLEVVRA
jgi:pSer/pThr/pTyr-binding forkhead associated (FHA) protein